VWYLRGGDFNMIIPGNIKAMIVDDNAYARTTVAAMLRKLGLEQIAEHGGGATAAASLLGERQDIMFMDWYMPDMNGAALLQLIRDARFGPNGQLPVVMMTAYPNRETFARAKELGANEVLTKPFSAAHVAAAFGRLLPDGWKIPDDGASVEDEAKFFL
jgi:two-component system, chemotaxis family, chemotaxis protein CheY